MRLKIRGRMWTIQEAAITCYGICHHTDRRIEIRKGQDSKDRVDTIIHELLHALNPKLPEEEIIVQTKVLMKGIWRANKIT